MTTVRILETPHPEPKSRKWVPLKWRWATAAFLLVLLAAIAAWVIWSLLRPNPEGFAPTAQAFSSGGSGTQQFTADARSRQDWVFFDLSLGQMVATTQDALDWDIAFRRNDMLTNGGETNAAGLGGAVDLGKIPLADATAPTAGFTMDVVHDDRGLENPDLHKWYSYNWTTHIISSKEHTYAVRTATGETALIAFLSYYCDDRTPACVTFQYKLLSAD